MHGVLIASAVSMQKLYYVQLQADECTQKNKEANAREMGVVGVQTNNL